MFVVDDFVAECRAALTESEPRRAIREVLDRALASPSAVADVLSDQRGGIRKLHHAPDLTVLNVIWAPGMYLRPHDHRMWAAIGVYGGEEVNTFYRRDPESGLTESGGKQLQMRDVVLLGDATIHSVANPRDHEFTGAIHIYNGDFFNEPRSQWDPKTLVETPFDIDVANGDFEAANAAWAARRPSA